MQRKPSVEIKGSERHLAVTLPHRHSPPGDMGKVYPNRAAAEKRDREGEPWPPKHTAFAIVTPLSEDTILSVTDSALVAPYGRRESISSRLLSR